MKLSSTKVALSWALSGTLQPGTCVYIDLNGREHPAVVTRLDIDRKEVLIIYGTGTRRCLDGRAVEHVTRDGKALWLTKTTYFYMNNTRLAGYDLIRPREGKCPPRLLRELEALAEEALSKMDEEDLIQGLSE